MVCIWCPRGIPGPPAGRHRRHSALPLPLPEPIAGGGRQPRKTPGGLQRGAGLRSTPLLGIGIQTSSQSCEFRVPSSSKSMTHGAFGGWRPRGLRPRGLLRRRPTTRRRHHDPVPNGSHHRSGASHSRHITDYLELGAWRLRIADWQLAVGRLAVGRLEMEIEIGRLLG